MFDSYTVQSQKKLQKKLNTKRKKNPELFEVTDKFFKHKLSNNNDD